MAEHPAEELPWPRRQRWSRRRNRLGIRNARFAVLLGVAALAGVTATVLTAYLGLR